MSASMNSLTEADIVRCLARAQEAPIDNPYPEHPFISEIMSGAPRPAAVLIPLLRKTGAWHALFTRRNASLPEHSGQVAFPGGRAEPGDSGPEQTALREAKEEIGLDPADVRILGRLYDFLTITNYRVTPVVGVIPWPYIFQLETEEVSRVFTIPLEWLADPENYEQRQRILPSPYTPLSVLYFRDYDGEVLWGASARFTLALVNILRPNGVYSQ